MKKLRLVIVGYGGMGEYHRGRLGALPYYEVVGVYDVDPARCKAAETQRLTVYDSFQAVAADETVDAVLIATPNDVHAFYGEYFTAHGKHMICEKPATLNEDDYMRMAASAEKYRKVLSVHQNRRWDADFLTVKKLLSDARLGGVYHVESRVLGANGIPGGWRKEPEHGGGMMLDWGVHLIDQLLTLTDGAITAVDCSYSYRQGFAVEDGFCCTFTFESGLTALVRVDTNSFIPLPRWLVYGKDGTAVIHDWDLRGEMRLAIYGDDAPIQGITAGNGFTKTMAYRPHSSEKSVPLPPIERDDDAFYRRFYESVMLGAENAVPHNQVARVLRVMALCKQSAEKREIIKGVF